MRYYWTDIMTFTLFTFYLKNKINTFNFIKFGERPCSYKEECLRRITPSPPLSIMVFTTSLKCSSLLHNALGATIYLNKRMLNKESKTMECRQRTLPPPPLSIVVFITSLKCSSPLHNTLGEIKEV
jgi:hypothetical protein